MTSVPFKRRGFTLMETVIAVGVLAVLITAFLSVFGPAAAGIRRAINAQEADRLASTLEKELGTLRDDQRAAGMTTAFDKAFKWIKESADTDAAKVPAGMIYVYQYRANPSRLRPDGTLSPYSSKSGGIAGTDYVVQSMARRRDDTLLKEDLAALEGRVFAVRTTQLIFKSSGSLETGTATRISDPRPPNTPSDSAANYPDAVIAFSAEFYGISSTSLQYLTGPEGFAKTPLKNPIFTRNLAVRR